MQLLRVINYSHSLHFTTLVVLQFGRVDFVIQDIHETSFEVYLGDKLSKLEYLTAGKDSTTR